MKIKKKTPQVFSKFINNFLRFQGDKEELSESLFGSQSGLLIK